jgi:SAM-dependent methyltransferase
VSSENRRPISPTCYDEDYFLGSCEGFVEFVSTEGVELSPRLGQALDVAEVQPGMRVLDIGCGRGEILRRCADLGVHAHGVDYSPVAVRMARKVVAGGRDITGRVAVYRADAKQLPFPDAYFTRVLMFDLVEHLHPCELSQALAEARRVLVPGGRLVIHTAPNVWYDRYAYPLVRLVRSLMGQGARYPADPRAIVPANVDVHVNEQSALGLWLLLRRMGFASRVWLATPPQNRREGWILRQARRVLFGWPPFRWFFEREVFAVAQR